MSVGLSHQPPGRFPLTRAFFGDTDYENLDWRIRETTAASRSENRAARSPSWPTSLCRAFLLRRLASRYLRTIPRYLQDFPSRSRMRVTPRCRELTKRSKRRRPKLLRAQRHRKSRPKLLTKPSTDWNPGFQHHRAALQPLNSPRNNVAIWLIGEPAARAGSASWFCRCGTNRLATVCCLSPGSTTC